mgnify:CR=1 FL=1
MARIEFENGVKVDFDGTPTEKDIEEVFQSIQKQGKLGKTATVVSETSERTQADKRSAERYGASFPAVTGSPSQGGDTPIKGGLKAAGNLPSSALGLGKSILGLVSRPLETMQGAGTLLAGGIEKLIPGKQKDEEVFDALTQSLKERYGSLENLQRKGISHRFTVRRPYARPLTAKSISRAGILFLE